MEFNQFNLFHSEENLELNFDLPDSEISLYTNFFFVQESTHLYKVLIEKINWHQDHINMMGKQIPIPRLNAWYGEKDLNYSYSGIQLQTNPWNEELLFIKRRIEKVLKIEFTSCLLNLYRDGNDSVDWHQDNEKELGVNPIIASVSFGATRNFQLKHIEKPKFKKTIELTHGSLLLMKGATQHYWKHKISKTKKNIQPRINLTFRKIIN